MDGEAQKKWQAYSGARDEMLVRTNTDFAPWVCVHTDHKKKARLAVIQHILQTLAPDEICGDYDHPDPKVLYRFEPSALTDGRLEP